MLFRSGDAEQLYADGVDVITLGNHSFDRREICQFLNDDSRIIRPANLSGPFPGDGFTVVDTMRGTVKVINLIGRCNMAFGPDNPFYEADRILKDNPADFTVVDFHAEATSEKYAMAYHLDGRVSALFGTHTHVVTADEQIFPDGMGYITDIGMTGPVNSVIGVKPEQSLAYYRGGLFERFAGAEGAGRLRGAIFDLDDDSGKCIGVERVDIE